MSLKPAIGKDWFLKYTQDIYGGNKDALHVKGRAIRPPKYYDALYDKLDNEHMAEIKSQRVNNFEGLTEQQMRARESNVRAKKLTKGQI